MPSNSRFDSQLIYYTNIYVYIHILVFFCQQFINWYDKVKYFLRLEKNYRYFRYIS